MAAGDAGGEVGEGDFEMQTFAGRHRRRIRALEAALGARSRIARGAARCAVQQPLRAYDVSGSTL